jgi:hypothetical protein
MFEFGGPEIRVAVETSEDRHRATIAMKIRAI